MKSRCPLCTRTISKPSQRWCECGAAMDSRCFDDHEPWCAVRGEERWIGALEL